MRIIILFITVILFSSCDNNLTSIGQDLIENDSYVQLINYQIDRTSTIKIDSFPTSTGFYTSSNSQTISKFLIGRVEDPITGITTATPYFQIAPSGGTLSTEYVYDSTTFNFVYRGEVWGDTTKMQTFYIHRLKDLPRLNPETDLLYDHDNTPYDPQWITTLRFIPEKDRLKNASFRFPNEVLGKMLYNMVLKNNDTIINSTQFIKFFKGLVIVPDPNNTCILSISAAADSLGIRLHYHNADGEGSYDFNLSDYYKEYTYTNYTNIAPAPYNTLITQKESVPFSTKQMAFTQGLDGYMIKVQIPVAPADNDYKTIIKAEIELKPVLNLFTEIGRPSELWVYKSDSGNNFNGVLMKGDNPVIGTLIRNTSNQEDDRYIVDITDYYDSLVQSAQGDEENYLIIGIPTNLWNSSFNRLLIDELPKLKVYYAQYER